MDRYRGKKVLIVGLGKTGFALINFFNTLECQIRVTDIKPIFDLNKAVKKLKKIRPTPEMTLGEHRNEDFLDADLVIYSMGVNCNLPQLENARSQGKEVYSEFGFAHRLCRKPIVAVCGSYGRTTVAHMIGYALKLEGKKVFVGGTSENPFINYLAMPDKDEVDWVVLDVSAIQTKRIENFHPRLVIFTNISDVYPEKHFKSVGEFIETKLSVIKNLTHDDYLIVNFDKLSSNTFFRNANCQVYWYSRKSFVKMGVLSEVQGTHFHDKRVHSNIHYHSEFVVAKMRIVGEKNRENLLASITAAKALKMSDSSIQTLIQKFPGIPHRLEFIVEKNGVSFYNDSKCEDMHTLIDSLTAFRRPVILIAGGKDTEQEFEQFGPALGPKARIMCLVGESKEKMNRSLGDYTQTYLVGSFEESVLLAYQKSRTGDVIVLSPGNQATDIFRDYVERGNYYKKLIFQL